MNNVVAKSTPNIWLTIPIQASNSRNADLLKSTSTSLTQETNLNLIFTS